MKRKLTLLITCKLFFVLTALSQVGIGTTTPNAKAVLEIKSTDKGVLFPRLTSAQRNAITNPPNGLHIYNTDESCLNYYDSLLTVWNCYCENDTCKVVIIKITASVDTIDFYQVYARNYPNTKKFVVIINSGVIIKGAMRNTSFVVRPGISFSSMPGTATVKIINNGSLYGLGGAGGQGASGDGFANGICSDVIVAAFNGTAGGNAIETNAGVKITIDNYGLIAGGAGGGGGGGRSAVGTQFGGGGGGGASFGFGGGGGWDYRQICLPIVGCGPCQQVQQAQAGTDGLLITGGPGGNGLNGGGNGGSGGALGQPGQNGFGTGAGTGGPIGKAVSGGSGNSLMNITGGISYGTVD